MVVQLDNNFGRKFKQDLENTLNGLQISVDTPVNFEKTKNPFSMLLFTDAVTIDFKNMKISVNSGKGYALNESYYIPFQETQIDISSLNLNSTNYNMYRLYVDISDNTLKIQKANDVNTKNLTIAYIYQTNVIGNENGIRIIERDGTDRFNLRVPDAAFEIKKMKNPIVKITHLDTIEFNYSTKKISLLKDLYVYLEGNHVKYINQSDFIQIDFSRFPLNSSDYNSYVLYLDLSSYQLKFDIMSNVRGRNLILTRVYQSTVHDNSEGIRVIDKDGQVVGKNIQKDGHDLGYLFTPNKINIDTTNRTVTVEQSQHILFTNKSYYVPIQQITYADGPTDYIRKLFVNKANGELVVGMHNDDKKGNLALICMWYHTGKNAVVIAPFGNEKRIKIDGLIYEDRGDTNNYNWSTNRFVLPKKLYLLKDVAYSISAQNFCYNKFTDNDKLMFELVTPNSQETFEVTGKIQSPIAVNLNTQVVGIYDGNLNNALQKDIMLQFADPSVKTKKNPRVLLIGDSVTNANIPLLVKYWLSNFGFIPSMIGTVSNSYDGYGYGITPKPTVEKGEGRAGWRLTDFTGTTKRTDGSIYLKPNNPFWNPETQTFDFGYYMRSNGFTGVDFIVIMLGINDISGYHGEKQTENIGTPTIEEILTYMPVEMKKMIDSIHEYDPNIKIGLNPPVPAGRNDNLNANVMKYTEMMQYHFDEKVSNVFGLGSYLSNGKLSGKTWDNTLTQVDPLNTTKRGQISWDVHDAGNNQMLNALWTASWIINQSA